MVNAIGREGPGETNESTLSRYRYVVVTPLLFRCNALPMASASFPAPPALHLLPPAEVARLLPSLALGQEAVVAGDPAVITWLQLRFGGTVSTALLEPELLHSRASGLPPQAPLAAVAL